MNIVSKKILDYNADRNPRFVNLKYKALCESPHRFFRGTCHLFNEYVAAESIIKKAPFAWVCGDLHLENFGTYKGLNRLVYFDINDFDEACIAPCTVDLVRLCTSVFLAGEELNFSEKEREKLCAVFIRSYCNEILKGHSSRIEKSISTGIIKTFYDKLESRNRKQFLKNRITTINKKLLIETDGARYVAIPDAEKKLLKKALKNWVKQNNRDKKYFRFIDAAQRIAGTGSLGLNRYCILIKGNGNPNYHLVDIKQAEASTLQQYFASKQTKFKSEAHRVVHAQYRLQDTAPAGLSTIKINDDFYILKEHQPTEDKFNLSQFKNDAVNFKEMLSRLGALLAWAQLRGSGRESTATADDLMKYANTINSKTVIDSSKKICKRLVKDYKNFKKDISSFKLEFKYKS